MKNNPYLWKIEKNVQTAVPKAGLTLFLQFVFNNYLYNFWKIVFRNRPRKISDHNFLPSCPRTAQNFATFCPPVRGLPGRSQLFLQCGCSSLSPKVWSLRHWGASAAKAHIVDPFLGCCYCCCCCCYCCCTEVKLLLLHWSIVVVVPLARFGGTVAAATIAGNVPQSRIRTMRGPQTVFDARLPCTCGARVRPSEAFLMSAATFFESWAAHTTLA